MPDTEAMSLIIQQVSTGLLVCRLRNSKRESRGVQTLVGSWLRVCSKSGFWGAWKRPTCGWSDPQSHEGTLQRSMDTILQTNLFPEMSCLVSPQGQQ